MSNVQTQNKIDLAGYIFKTLQVLVSAFFAFTWLGILGAFFVVVAGPKAILTYPTLVLSFGLLPPILRVFGSSFVFDSTLSSLIGKDMSKDEFINKMTRAGRLVTKGAFSTFFYVVYIGFWARLFTGDLIGWFVLLSVFGVLSFIVWSFRQRPIFAAS